MLLFFYSIKYQPLATAYPTPFLISPKGEMITFPPGGRPGWG